MCESDLAEELREAREIIAELRENNDTLLAKLKEIEEKEGEVFENKLHRMTAIVDIDGDCYELSFDKLNKSNQKYEFNTDDQRIVKDLTRGLTDDVNRLENSNEWLSKEIAEFKEGEAQYKQDIKELENRNQALEETLDMVKATSPTPIEVSDGSN